ncbi:unnamed protein product [Camellia sinensis]
MMMRGYQDTSRCQWNHKTIQNDCYQPLPNGHKLFFHDIRWVAVRAAVAMGEEGDMVLLVTVKEFGMYGKWKMGDEINSRGRGDALYEMAFLSSLNQIASIEWESMSGEFMPEFFKLVLGTLSLPINFLGTNYHRGFQAQENIVSMLRRLVEERRACQETKHDMLGLLMNGGEENRYNLTDEEKIDQMIAILYSGYETVM